MRTLAATLIAILSVAIAACSAAKPPQGRWQGTYADDAIMIAARVEIGADGRVRLSAPNALADFATMPEADKTDVRARLLASLASAWPSIKPREMDFDGKAFRNPGGVAPQLEWDDGTRTMTMVVYLGSQPTVRVKLEKVDEFSG